MCVEWRSLCVLILHLDEANKHLNEKLVSTSLDIGGGTMGANPSLLTCKTKNRKWKSLPVSHLYINKFSLFKEYKKYNDNQFSLNIYINVCHIETYFRFFFFIS
jgi:hypothetical protein